MVPSTPNAQAYAILATPQGSIQSDDGNICIDRQGNVTWPASDANCGITTPAPTPAPTPALTMPHEDWFFLMFSFRLGNLLTVIMAVIQFVMRLIFHPPNTQMAVRLEFIMTAQQIVVVQ